jgi:hypothetical protein
LKNNVEQLVNRAPDYYDGGNRHQLAKVFGKPSVTFSYDLHGYDPVDDTGPDLTGLLTPTPFYYKTTARPREESSYYLGGKGAIDLPRAFPPKLPPGHGGTMGKFQVSRIPGP